MIQIIPNSSVKREDIFNIKDLPEPSESLMRVTSLLCASEVRVKPLIDAIERDPVLVARILKLVNSSYYSLRNNIDSITLAVTLLGLTSIKHIVYSSACFGMFHKNEREEWDHSYSTSLLVANLLREHRIPVAGTIQLTALMHDLGKIVFRRKYTRKYQRALSQAHHENIPAFQKERLFLTYDHSDVGAWLLEAWDMPESIITPIFFHHMENLPEMYALETAVLKLADWIDCSARDIDLPQPSIDLLEPYGLSISELGQLVNAQVNLIKSLDSDLTIDKVA